MSLAAPWMLLLALPAAALWAYGAWTRGGAGGALPGAWRQVISAPLRPHLAGRLAARSRGQRYLPLVIAGLVILALARPLWDRGGWPPAANFSGRALVVDTSGAAADWPTRRRLTAQLMGLADGVPTALVAVSGDAFTVVPLTRDHAHLSRYLMALSPAVMPVDGRALATGMAAGETLLAEAAIVTRQVVLVTAGPAPGGLPQMSPSPGQRILMVAGDQSVADAAAWRAVGAKLDAGLWPARDVEGVGRVHARAQQRQARRRLGAAAGELTPGVIVLALILWLPLLRRRAVS